MAKNKYPHFNPEKHKIESKIATVKTGSHCKFNINYHIIWIPKYRKHLLKGKVICAVRSAGYKPFRNKVNRGGADS